MAKYWTWLEVKTKVLNDLDLNDEDFITPDELLGYANEAIDEAEQEILTIYEDYFLVKENLALVAGQSLYDLPADIYAHKIRSIHYDDGGARRYIIRRFRNLKKVNWVNENDEFYKYVITNSLADGPKIQLYPSSKETSSTNVEIWFLRNAREITADTDVIDIPEAHKFIIQHIKLRCYEKEGSPKQLKAAQDLARERELLVSTLSAMVPDEDNRMLLDMGFYDDYDNYHYGWRTTDSFGDDY